MIKSLFFWQLIEQFLKVFVTLIKSYLTIITNGMEIA